jgi:sirohydrochlorin cobaltochelatase
MSVVLPSTSVEALLLIAQGGQSEADRAVLKALEQAVSARLAATVRSCSFGLTEPGIAEGIQACVQAGARRVVVCPLFFEATEYQQQDLPTLLAWAQSYWPQVSFRLSSLRGVSPSIVDTLAQRSRACLPLARPNVPEYETCLLLVGQGSQDAESNADVVKIARLLWERQAVAWVETGFATTTRPAITSSITRCVQLGAKRIIVLPYMLSIGHIDDLFHEQIRLARELHRHVDLVLAEALGSHDGVVRAVLRRYQEAVNLAEPGRPHTAPTPSSMVQGQEKQTRPHRHTHGGRSHSHSSTSALESLLPPRYQGGLEVSSAPMSAAPLQYDADGRVAWDQIWTGFCDLALAGGPSHRAALLEPVPPEAVRADPDGYEWVLAELERGIRLVADLQVVRSKSPGWIGVRCTSEEMALWLLRAIVVENICVRREASLLYLPAGPHFRLEHEIKSIVTVIAKTYHYWTEHILDT